ncbi:alpha/beta hydrolase fold domain-containing protein [Thioclava sp. 'Guangxiensis']|uniref:alpha/beta hydrolase fold domain-containing protein n=1 Tax=Thioclava sp. 'Guangxiensis' TaxID=3149044 RepID=UPI003877EE78
MSLRVRMFNMMLRHMVKRRFRRITGPHEARAALEGGTHRLPIPSGLLVQRRDLGAVPALSVRAGVIRDYTHAVLYLHGGAYLAGSAWHYRGLAGEISRHLGAEVILPEYRLAPDHPLPAAPEDALAAWDGLLAKGFLPQDIAIAGDSAGGGLALGLLARLCARGTPPAATCVMSPWTDLAGQGASLRENAEADPILPAEQFGTLVDMLLAGAAPDDPLISPLYSRFDGAGPVLIQHSLTEILCDDSLRMADRLRGFGVDVTVQSWPDTPHVWQIFARYLPEAEEAIEDLSRFIRRAWTAGPPAEGGS